MAHRGVHEPPGIATAGLVKWALDTWPYVNGKATARDGLNLVEMEASQMMDVLHFYFEEDFTYRSEEEAQSQSGLRLHLYEELYSRRYNYKIKKSKSASNSSASYADGRADTPSPTADIDSLNDVKPFDPLQKEKPPLPPADEFDGTSFPGLDAPLG